MPVVKGKNVSREAIAEALRCDTVEALLEVAPPEKVNDGHHWWAGCEYWNAASALVRGEEVTR